MQEHMQTFVEEVDTLIDGSRGRSAEPDPGAIKVQLPGAVTSGRNNCMTQMQHQLNDIEQTLHSLVEQQGRETKNR